jgi:predicted phosphodiesterase
MFYITADTHGAHDIEKLNTRQFPKQKELTKNDYVIICGDFGCVWGNGGADKYWLDWLNGKNFTTLFVDGNHENFDLLYQYEVEEWCGGKIHRLRDSVIHLMRGEVYTIAGKKFFAMGGASSHDKPWRIEGQSWWKEELPSDSEYENAMNNLKKHDYKVDCIISHCCADSVQARISTYYKTDMLTKFFERVVKADCGYDKWFFGHYHEDIDVDDRHIALYNRIVELQ